MNWAIPAYSKVPSESDEENTNSLVSHHNTRVVGIALICYALGVATIGLMSNVWPSSAIPHELKQSSNIELRQVSRPPHSIAPASTMPPEPELSETPQTLFSLHKAGKQCSDMDTPGYVDPYKYGCCPDELPEFELHLHPTESSRGSVQGPPVIINSNIEILHLLNHFRGTRVLFLGDSLMGQTFDAFLLGARSRGIPDTGVTITTYYSTNDTDYMALTFPDSLDTTQMHSDGGQLCIIADQPVQCSVNKVFHTTIPSHNITVEFGQAYRLLVPERIGPPDFYMGSMTWVQAKDMLEQSDYALINIGIHSEPRTYREIMYYLVNEILNPAPAKIVFRNAYPQHFAEPTGHGYYPGPDANITCVDRVELQSLQSETAVEVFGKAHTHIPLINPFPMMQSLGKYHFAERMDCTHYCYTPSIWNGVWYLWRDALNIPYQKAISS